MESGHVIAGRYRVEHLMYQGGMGAVYIGHDLHTGAEVGIKLLQHPESPSMVSRFSCEARALASLRHPAIVPYRDHGVTDTGAPYLIMDWLQGENLAERLRFGPLNVPDTLRLGIRVCAALAAAHRHDIVHRDIKPDNLLLPGGSLDQVTVVDFGLALVGDSLADASAGVHFMGTPEFMSPEHARSDFSMDHRADIYSLGASLFTCLTQQTPFTGERVTAILAKVLFDDPPRLSDVRIGVPKALDELVTRMLAKDPDDRPGDAEEVAAELAAILDRLHSDRRATTAPAITTGEQRFATVLLVHASPAVRTAYRRGVFADPARLHGADLEVMADGTIAGIFSQRDHPTEAAARAARCALALQELGAGTIVLATSRGLVRKRLMVGQVIDRAAELLHTAVADRSAQAPPEGWYVTIDDATAGLLHRRFSLASAGPRCYRLLPPTQDVGAGPRLLGVVTSCLGRDHELAHLSGLLQTCAGERRARVALVTGAAGVGKSRLRAELGDRVGAWVDGGLGDAPAPAVWLGRGDWLRAGAAFGLLAEILRDAMGLAAGQPAEEWRACITARVAELGDSAETARIAAFLGEILRTPFDDPDNLQLTAARHDAQVMHDQMRRAFLDWLAAELDRHPVLILVDDAHWGDAPSFRFLEAAVHRLADRPLMLAVFARAQGGEPYLEHFTRARPDQIHLEPLSPETCRVLVRQVLNGSHAVPEEVVERVIERSEGNAFFLEELLRSVHESDEDALPQTVLAVAEARLAALPDHVRRVLRAASIFGRTFWRGGVAALVGDAMDEDTLDAILAALVEREFIAERAEARFAGEREYRFASELTREVAYGTLTADDRSRGHVRAGLWLTSAGETATVVLAEHFRRGDANERAVDCYLCAAQQALDANDGDAVMEHAEQAEACGAAGVTLGTLRLLQAEVHNWRSEPEAARRRSFEAMKLLPRGSAAWANATHHAAWAHGSLGRLDDVTALLELLEHCCSNGDQTGNYIIAMAYIGAHLMVGGRYEQAQAADALIAAAVAKSPPDARVSAAVSHMRSVQAFFADELDRACDLMCEAVSIWSELGNQRKALMEAGNAGFVQCELGEYEHAAETLRGTVEDAHQAGLDHLVRMNRGNLARALGRMGQLDEALAICQQAIDEAGSLRIDTSCRTYLAELLLRAGRYDEGLAQVDRALVIAEGVPSLCGEALGVRARLLLRLQRPREALRAATAGMDILDRLGAIDGGEAGLRLAHAEALYATHRVAAAKAAIAAARERLLARAAHITDPARRRSFLSRVAEHAATMELAGAWA
ncbi:serine/threonine-protein kinase PknK [Haliangium sp.]|uniref:serine/threonine-protein kinase n=1 Tax=Haliangium sp. TaxID=2663208 RepID=UPI003D10F066